LSLYLTHNILSFVRYVKHSYCTIFSYSSFIYAYVCGFPVWLTRSTFNAYFSLLVTLQPRSVLGRLIMVMSRSHTIRHTQPVGRQGTSVQLDIQDATYTTYNHNRRISMHSVGFEPAIPAIERPQTNASDRMVTGIDLIVCYLDEFCDIIYYRETYL